MGVLAVYDIIGIQNFIFSSNRLAENVGASKLVANIFAGKKVPEAGVLPRVIKQCTGSIQSKWSEGELDMENLKAEIIYQGGGNAYVAFADEPLFQKVTEAFLVKVNKYAPGLGVAVAAIETDFDNYRDDFDVITDRLTLVKGGFNTPMFAGNQPITKQSWRTGLPVRYHDDEEKEFMSICQQEKRNSYKKHKKEEKEGKKEFEDLVFEKDADGSISIKKDNDGIKKFEDLVFEKDADSFIAIIHADGNNMGKRIKDYMGGFESYEEAVPEIRQLVTKIDKCYRDALKRTVNDFKEAYENYLKETVEDFKETYEKYLKKQQAKYPDRIYKINAPLLELIVDGDDITVLTSGRFAIDFAARLLRAIEKTEPDKLPFGETPTASACAGVVLFHSHYPFSEAYKLAEGLCKRAKYPSRDLDGSYIDFHLHSSGRVESLQQLRSKQYTVDGKSIIKRPWKVPKDINSKITGDFSWFVENIKNIKEISQLPKNKTKAIRNAIAEGEGAVKLAENQLRGKELPKYPDKMYPNESSKYSALFDLLEVCDTYVNLLNDDIIV